MPGGGISESYWRALFRFASGVGSNDPVNQTSSMRTLSPEDKAFLEGAMREYAKSTDPVLQLKGRLANLSKVDFHTMSMDEVESAMTEMTGIEDLCYHADLANDFHKVGGYRVLMPMLASPNPEFRSGAANLIAVLAQNNPYSQKELAKAGIFDVLLEMLDSDENDQCRVKALYALSCLVRESEENTATFTDKNGFSYLMRALQTDITKLKIKAAFLLQALGTAYPSKAEALSIGLIDQLFMMWARSTTSSVGNEIEMSNSTQLNELLAAAIVAFASDSPQIIRELRRSDLRANDIIQYKLSQLDKDDEEAMYCRQLLELIKRPVPHPAVACCSPFTRH